MKKKTSLSAKLIAAFMAAILGSVFDLCTSDTQ